MVSASAEVSVVTPTRNRLSMLQQAVDSVLRQTFDAWELVVVDDASDDGTWEWLSSLSNPRIRSFRLEERGEQSRARNTGVKASTAPIVVSLDDDDLLTPTALERHVEALREHPQAIASVGGHENFDDQGAKKRYQLVRRKQVRSIYRDILFGWMATAGESAFRREILERVNYWDESWLRATDHELWSRVGSLGDVVILPDIVLNYRVHSGQWRPPDLEAIVTRAREKAVALTEGEQRRSGEETLAVRSVFQRAYEHFLAARAWVRLGSLSKGDLAHAKPAHVAADATHDPTSDVALPVWSLGNSARTSLTAKG